MARTIIRESQVLASDFASGDELEERFALHNQNNIHVPLADFTNDKDRYLFFDGTDYIWSEVEVPDITQLLPAADKSNEILKTDDDNNWIVVDAADPENGLKVISLPYHWDADRQKYLDNQALRLINYDNGTNKSDSYMNYIPEIPSSTISFRVLPGEKYDIVGYEYNTENSVSGDVMEIRKITGRDNSLWGTTVEYDTLYTINLSDNVNYDLNTLLDIEINEGDEIATYILSQNLDNPSLILILRKIWEDNT